MNDLAVGRLKAQGRISPVPSRPPSSRTPRRAISARPAHDRAAEGLGGAVRRREEGARRRDQRRQAGDRGRADRAARANSPIARTRSAARGEALDVTLARPHARPRRPASRSAGRWSASKRSSRRMGFDVADGPEIETDWYSFTALNNPDEPSGALDAGHVLRRHQGRRRHRWLNLRPHTSPMQIRHAHGASRAAHAGGRRSMPEIRVIAPGRTYRVDSDATHSPMFHQCEGLWLGENVSFKDLKACISISCRPSSRATTRAAFSAQLLPVHRAQRRDRHPVPEPVRSPAAGSRSPAPGRCIRNVVRNMGFDPERLHRLRFRHRARPAGDAALRRQRPAPVLRRRPALPAPVPVSRPRSTTCNSPSPGCASSATRRSPRAELAER